MDTSQTIQIPLGEYLDLKEIEKHGQSIKFEHIAYHTQQGETGHSTPGISWHLPHHDADLERQLCSQISALIIRNRSLSSLLKKLLVFDFSFMTRAEFRAWQKRASAAILEDFMKEEFVITSGEDEVYEKQRDEIAKLKTLLKSIAEQSQLVLDKPKYTLSEDHCNGIRTALGNILQKPAAEESSKIGELL